MVSARSPAHPNWIAELTTSRKRLMDRFRQTGASKDLDEAVKAAEALVDAFPKGQVEQAAPLSILGTLICTRFEQNGVQDDIDRAVEVSETAVKVTPSDDVDYPAWLTNLGNRLTTRFEWNKVTGDLERAVEVSRNAVNATPPGDPNRAGRLTNLGLRLKTQFEETQDISDLNEAVDFAELAIEAAPPGHKAHVACLVNLGNHLQTRYQRTGSLQDLNRAVQATDSAVSAASSSVHRNTALMGHGASLSMRYDLTGGMEDLNSAIEAARDALADLPPENPMRPALLDNLGIWMKDRYERTGALEDINMAIKSGEMALLAAPPRDPRRVAMLVNLGNRFRIRYDRDGDVEDIRHAIDRAQQSVDASLNSRDKKPVCLACLADCLASRYKRTDGVDDLNKAIEITEEVVETAPSNLPSRANWLSNMATYLMWRYERDNNPEDREQALTSLLNGWNTQTAPATTRIRLAHRAAIILVERHAQQPTGQQHWQQSSELLENALGLLSTASPRFLEHSDKQYVLGQFAGLASMAAATALNAKKEAIHALGLLELGRDVIASLVLEMRTDLSALVQKFPKLAKEFTSLRDELDAPTSRRTTVFSVDEVGTSYKLKPRTQGRLTAEERLQEVLKTIRSQPGFASFLLPPTADEVSAVAAPGPIVVLNISTYRCDAFLVQEGFPVRVLELPDLHLKNIEEKVKALGTKDSPILLQTLGWLWDVAACRILDVLNFKQRPADDGYWPHVWWIPTGLLSQLPIHAAGRHYESSSNTVMDRVMSSYSSSMKAMIYGRRNRDPTLSREASKKAVLTDVPGSGLSYSEDEVTMVEKFCQTLGLQSLKPAAELSTILEHLRDCHIFHFASHGQSNPLEPSQSYLDLGQEAGLTVVDLRDCRLQEKAPFLAYLSACSTKTNKAGRLVDEEIHLVSACHLAGFRNVVGTLWEVLDRRCLEVAGHLYETLVKEGMEDEAVCRGLHFALRALRDGKKETSMGDDGKRTSYYIGLGTKQAQKKTQTPKNTDWVPYVHFGI